MGGVFARMWGRGCSPMCRQRLAWRKHSTTRSAVVGGVVRRTHRAGINFALHSLSATYTQFAVFSPNQQRQLGDDHGRFYVTPLGRGPDGWYSGAAEADFFEVWADLAHHFRLDPNRVALSGYSMGG